MTETAIVARITGCVQGVAYRDWARRTATRLTLRGWVRNEDDGSVTALVIGPEDTVDKLVEAMKGGPPAARVSEVVTMPGADDGSPGFEIVL